jgi:hypothetical protein
MDLLFGVKPKPKEEPKVDINAPTLTDTSKQVTPLSLSYVYIDGLSSQGDSGQSR